MNMLSLVKDWQATLPDVLPNHVKRNISQGENDCWLWMRSKSRDGYGWASLNNRTYQAHRLVYRLVIGDIAPGKVLDHLCRVRHCVNPSHLEPVTPAENISRSELTPAGMKHCMKCGGPFSVLHGQRRCLSCLSRYEDSRRERKRIQERERRARKRDAA